MGISLGLGIGIARAVGGSAGVPFSPLDLGSSLQLWLDGQDLTTLYTDSTETTPSANGANVGRWKDKSGNNRHADKTNITANYPVRNDAGIGTHCAVDFDTGVIVPGLAAPWFTGPGTNIPGGQRFEVWAVYKPSVTTGGAYIVTSEDGSWWNWWTIWVSTTAGTFPVGHNFYANLNWNAANSGVAAVLGPHAIVRGVIDTTLANGCVSATADGVAGVMTPGYDNPLGSATTPTRPVFIGSNLGGSQVSNAAIGEVIYVDRHLTPSEAAGMQAYLSGKWS